MGSLPSARMMPQTVTITTKTWSNVGGQRTPSTTTTTAIASVQPMKADRQALLGLDVGVRAVSIFFTVAPAVRTNDVITCALGTFSVLGPAADMAGRGMAYRVDCQEIV